MKEQHKAIFEKRSCQEILHDIKKIRIAIETDIKKRDIVEQKRLSENKAEGIDIVLLWDNLFKLLDELFLLYKRVRKTDR